MKYPATNRWGNHALNLFSPDLRKTLFLVKDATDKKQKKILNEVLHDPGVFLLRGEYNP